MQQANRTPMQRIQIQIHILLLEDCLTDAASIQEMLPTTYSVHHAQDIEQAWHLLKNQPIDILLLDVLLPKDSGFAFLRQVKRNPLYAGLPVLICSHQHDLSDKVWAEKLGANAFLDKPIEKNCLLPILTELTHSI